MHAQEESARAYSNHVAGRARRYNRDCFASLAMTEPEPIEKIPSQHQKRPGQEKEITAFLIILCCYSQRGLAPNVSAKLQAMRSGLCGRLEYNQGICSYGVAAGYDNRVDIYLFYGVVGQTDFSNID